MTETLSSTPEEEKNETQTKSVGKRYINVAPQMGPQILNV